MKNYVDNNKHKHDFDWLRAVRLIPTVLSQCNLVLSVQICVITFWRGKTFTGNTNMAAKARQTQGTSR